MPGAVHGLLPGLTIDNTLGALFIGFAISVCLFGAICVQAFNYFNNYPDDRLYIKIMVIAILSLEFSHTAFLSHALYLIMVSSFGTTSFFVDVPWTLKTSVLMSGLINSIAQSFFANRIRIISRAWTVPIICWLLILVRLVAVVSSSMVALLTELITFSIKFNWLLTISLVATFVVDVTVACAFAFYLARSRTGFMNSDRLVRRLILFSIESGLITSVIATVVLTMFLIKPHTFIWVGLLLILAKVYSNSLLYSLNARQQLRSDQSGSRGVFKAKSASVSNINAASQNQYSSQQRNASRFEAVVVEMTTMRSSDFPLDQDVIAPEDFQTRLKQMEFERRDSAPFQSYRNVKR